MLSFSIALGALSVLLLLSGLDDLIPLMLCLRAVIRLKLRRGAEAAAVQEQTLERRMAIFVPCWHESAVIGNMVRHNLAAIRYHNYHFFLGVYPNDEATLEVAGQLAADFANVHVAECGNPGPTSKADCLNWVYARMERFEEAQGVKFDTVILHDAEDLIHPLALSTINRERARYEMVQIPVLPLKTGLAYVTHGIYCDEFSEYQLIDMRARQESGSFVPSNGVGTGFAREVLARLARESNSLVFDPASLTEDYAIGIAIHQMGYRQTFSPLTPSDQGLIATREYFPRTTSTAIRQRTRWITGIALQCWERYGWRGSLGTRYWFWRDRKGLLTNPLSVLANLLFIAGLFDFGACSLMHWPWHFTVQSPSVARLCIATLAIQCLRTTVRACCVGRTFGPRIAITVPLRIFHANLINCAATYCALRGYIAARSRKRTLVWQKTDHAYPGSETLHAQRRELSEVLIGCGYLTEDELKAVRAHADSEMTMNLLLLSRRLITEDQLCRAVSLQSGLAPARLDVAAVNANVLRAFPTQLEKELGALPFAVRSGKLLLATIAAPSSAIIDKARKYCDLPVDFQLVTPTAYAELKALAG